MKKKIIATCTVVSTAFFFIFVSLYIYAMIFDPNLYVMQGRPLPFRVSLGDASVSVTKLWGGMVIFFNQESPYTGGVVRLTDGKNISGENVSDKGWDGLGIYFRLIKDTSRTDAWWTFMFSFWYPIIIFGILPLVCLWQRFRPRPPKPSTH